MATRTNRRYRPRNAANHPSTGRLQDARWEQDSSIGPEQKWCAIECEMNRRVGMSTLHAEEGLTLTFLGVSAVDGKHECRPATSEELKAPEIEFEKLCSTEFTHEQMSSKHWRLKTSEILIEVFGLPAAVGVSQVAVFLLSHWPPTLQGDVP